MSFGKRRSILAIFDWIRRWIVGETLTPPRPVRWRTMPSRALADGEPALVRGQDAQFLPVLCDGPSRDRQALLAERARDVLVRQGLGQLFLRHQILDHLLDADRGNLVALSLGNPAVEEELERQYTLRRLHELSRGHAAHR